MKASYTKTLGSALRDHSLQAWKIREDAEDCSWPCARQVPYLLYYCSGPQIYSIKYSQMTSYPITNNYDLIPLEILLKFNFLFSHNKIFISNYDASIGQ